QAPLTYWCSRVRAAACCPPRPGGGSCHGADHGGLDAGASSGPGGWGRTRRGGRQAHDQRLAETGFFAIARQLPGLIGQAIRLGWQANRRDTVATIGLNLVSGI